MLKIKDILDKKVVYSENLGDEYYWDYRIIVQYNEKQYILIEYSDSYSGYVPFAIECVDKEFVSAFFTDYYDKNRIFELNLETERTLKDEIDFEYDKEWLDTEVILVEYKDIKDFVKID